MPNSKVLPQNETLTFFDPLSLTNDSVYNELVILIIANNLEKFKDLIEHNNVDLNKKFQAKLNVDNTAYDFAEVTLMHIAALYNRPELISFLAQENASLNERCVYATETFYSQDRTPLHLASLFGSCDAIISLRENGADECLNDANGYSPLALAKDKSYLYFGNNAFETETRKNDEELEKLQKINHNYITNHLRISLSSAIAIVVVIGLLVIFPPAGLVITSTTLLGLAFAGLGIWALASFVSISTPDYKIGDRIDEINQEKYQLRDMLAEKKLMKQNLDFAKVMGRATTPIEDKTNVTNMQVSGRMPITNNDEEENQDVHNSTVSSSYYMKNSPN